MVFKLFDDVSCIWNIDLVYSVCVDLIFVNEIFLFFNDNKNFWKNKIVRVIFVFKSNYFIDENGFVRNFNVVKIKWVCKFLERVLDGFKEFDKSILVGGVLKLKDKFLMMKLFFCCCFCGCGGCCFMCFMIMYKVKYILLKFKMKLLKFKIKCGCLYYGIFIGRKRR